MCRFELQPDFKIEVDKKYVLLISERFPIEFKAKLKQIKALEEERKLSFYLEFTIGNTHEIKKDPKPDSSGEYLNRHLWTAFVRLAPKHKNVVKFSKIVESVHFKLHSSFRKDSHTFKVKTGQESVKLTYSGWGTFDMPITITFKKELGIPP